ncbi:MAG: GNAT family N-acetyltransferase [Nocardiopsaceae bacterium]|nr:GNAT family N-acetyltransferase [Nocardiopsaceae bacterium]
MTERVELRPVTEDDLPVMDSLLQDPAVSGEFAWFGWHDPLRFRRAWEEDRLLGEQRGGLMVVAGSDRLGFVNWRRRQTTPAGWCWEMGIAILPGARGRGYGTQAHRLLVSYLFAHTTVHRIEAATETGNVAEQKALASAGFTREGVSRGIGWRDGAWRDGVIYSILRSDLPDSAG